MSKITLISSDGHVPARIDLPALDSIAGEVGLELEDVLSAPAVQPSRRGDLDRPLVTA